MAGHPHLSPVAGVTQAAGMPCRFSAGPRSARPRANRDRAWLRRRGPGGVLIGASVAVALLGTGGSAYAYFSAHGSGTGTAKVGALAAVTATIGTPTTPLFPGGSGDAEVKLTNPNGFALTLTAFTPSGSVSVTGGSGCTAANAGVSFNSLTGLSYSVPANATTTVDIAGAASMSASSNNGCQGASFTSSVTITLVQG